jgi:hypothetical protein
MDNENAVKEQLDADRRKFIKRAGAMAVTAPAAGMILSAASRPALAQAASGRQPEPEPEPEREPEPEPV